MPDPPVMRVVAVQRDLSAAGNAMAAAALVATIVQTHPGTLVAFPELCLQGYDLRRAKSEAIAPDGPELALVAEAARAARSAVVVGFAEAVAGAVANSAACVDEGGALVGVRRKSHLFGEERAVFAAGDELRPVLLGGLQLGVMVCFDVEFPEVARTLARRGAEILVTIAANMAPFGDDHDTFVRARAREGGCAHLYANLPGGQAADPVFVGRSQVVAADGRLLGRLGDGPGVLEVDLEPSEGGDPRLDYLHQLRDDLYEVPRRPDQVGAPGGRAPG